MTYQATTADFADSRSINREPQSKRKAYLDGSNLLLGLRDNSKPSILLFANVVAALSRHGFDVVTIFDQSIRHHLERFERSGT